MSDFNSYRDELEYLIDKVENPENNKTWVDMVDDLNLTVHPDVLRKSFTGGRYGGYQVAKYFINKETESLPNEEIERLTTLKDDIYKERCKIADLNRTKNFKLRDEARFEVLLETLKNAFNCLEPIKLNKCKDKTINKRITGVLQLSDIHIGKLINNQWNVYNNDVAVERMGVIVDKVITKSKLHKVTDLIVEINGDIIDGIIQVSSRNAEEADVISQIVFASELLSQAINDLKPHYENVVIVTTLGNHGRIFADKKMGSTKENFEMLIPEFLKMRINDVPLITSKGLDFTSYEINGELICVSHGQNDKLSDVISDFAKMYKRMPKEVHLGHTHSYKDINDCDIYVTVNGSLCGSDDYSITCRKISKPSQNFIVYGDDRCIYSLSAVQED